MDLCGHATVAASEILFNNIGIKNDQIIYETKSGRLIASKTVDGIALDFPIDEVLSIDLLKDILEAMGIENYENAIIGKNTRKLVIHLQTEREVLELSLNFEKMKCLNFGTAVKGVGVTCRGMKTTTLSPDTSIPGQVLTKIR